MIRVLFPPVVHFAVLLLPFGLPRFALLIIRSSHIILLPFISLISIIVISFPSALPYHLPHFIGLPRRTIHQPLCIGSGLTTFIPSEPFSRAPNVEKHFKRLIANRNEKSIITGAS